MTENTCFLIAGDEALVVQFSDKIDPLAEAQTQALFAALSGAPLAGQLELVPTYRSLMVRYDPEATTADKLEQEIKALLPALQVLREKRGTTWLVPVCYDLPHGEDLAAAAEGLALSERELIALHTGTTFGLAMYGFAPGYAYLSGCPEGLAIARRKVVRPPIPENSVMIAGGQAIIAPIPMPTGWYVLGRTPVRTCNWQAEEPFLFEVGDKVRFEAVGAADFAELEARAVGGENVARTLP